METSGEIDMRLARLRGSNDEYRIFYSRGYDCNWDAIMYSDGEGHVYFEDELEFDNDNTNHVKDWIK